MQCLRGICVWEYFFTQTMYLNAPSAGDTLPDLYTHKVFSSQQTYIYIYICLARNVIKEEREREEGEKKRREERDEGKEREQIEERIEKREERYIYIYIYYTTEGPDTYRYIYTCIHILKHDHRDT